MRGWFRSGALAFALVALTQGIPGTQGDRTLHRTIADRVAQSAAPLDVRAVEAIVTESQHAGVPNEYALELATAVDGAGKPIFNTADITQFHKHNVPTATAITLNAVRDGTGQQVLDTEGITAVVHADLVDDFQRFWSSDYCKSYAQRFSDLHDIAGRPALTAWDTYRAWELNLTSIELGSFMDTEAPNAVVVLPRSDYNGAFLSDSYQKLMTRITSTYDCHVVFADREYQVQSALDMVPDISLLLLTGHGSYCSVALSNGFGEAGTIDCTDDELRKSLKSLIPDATVILYSCSTGSGGEHGTNLANALSGMRRSMAIFAPTDLLNGVEFGEGFPADLQLKYTAQNVTYCTR